MKYSVVLLLCLFTIVRSAYNYCEAPTISPSQNTDGLTLKQVLVHFRHGDRTPVHHYPFINNEWDCSLTHDIAPRLPNSQYPTFQKLYIPGRNVLPGNCFYGQLTAEGLDQHHRLGKDFSALYSSYNLKATPSSMWLRTSDVPRTIDSAMGFVYGYFDGKIEGLQLNTMDSDMEDMWANSNICPNLDEVEGKIKNSTAYLAWKESVHPYKKQIEELLKIKDFGWGELADALNCAICHDFPIPPGITENITMQLLANSFTEWSFLWNDYTYGKLGSGMFLGEIVEKMLQFVNGDQSLNLVLYGGHDTTVGPLGALLQIADGYWPPYRAHIEFELWQNESTAQWFVQLKYNGIPTQAPYCSSVMCPWLEFFNHVIQLVPSAGDCGPN